MDISGATVVGMDALADAVAVFKDNGLDIDVLDSVCDSEDGEHRGDTSGVDTAGVDVGIDALASRGWVGLGMDVVEVNVAGADAPCFEGEIGDNCTGVNVSVFEGEEQEGSVVPSRTSVVEERSSS